MRWGKFKQRFLVSLLFPKLYDVDGIKWWMR
jgi:hypothetical protein